MPIDNDDQNTESGESRSDPAGAAINTAARSADARADGAEREQPGDTSHDQARHASDIAAGHEAAAMTGLADDLAAGEEAGTEPAANEAVMTLEAVMDATLTSNAAPPPNEQLVVIIEAIVFASPEPITLKAMLKLLDTEPKEQVQAAIDELRRRYDDRPGGLQLVEVANGYQIVTRPELHEWVRRMFHERTTQKLSVQALETLAVIAYKQPITAAEITEIRGVNTAGVIGTLLERGLAKISGRKQVVGRPFLYSTTREFLDRFGLRDLNDLPKVEDLAGALGFEVPAGIATEAQQTLPADEPATDEDTAVVTGEGGEEDGGADEG